MVINQRRIITLNNRMENRYEKRESLFHEVGHDSNPEHRKRANGSPLYDTNLIDVVDKTEREANIISAHLMLDKDKVIELLLRGISAERVAQIFHVHLDLLILELEEAKKLMGKEFPLDLANLPRTADPCFLKASNGMVNEYAWYD